MGFTDARLYEKWAAARDADTFAEIVSRYSGMVYGTCRRILRNATEAEDVAQECFMELAQAGATIKHSLGGWLHAAAVHRSLNRLKAEKRRKDREAHFASNNSSHTETKWDDIQPHIDEAIAALPEKFREPVIQRFLEGRTHEAIAQNLSISRTTAQYRLEKGIESIRKFLKRRGISAATSAIASLLVARTSEAVPASLTASLGKLALTSGSGLLTPVAATQAASPTSILMTLGGILVSAKKIVALGTILIVVVAGWYILTKTPIRNTGPTILTEQATPDEESSLAGTDRQELMPRTEEETNLPDDVEKIAEEPAPATSADAAQAELLEISGRVLDSEGIPANAAEVTTRAEDDHTQSIASVLTDTEGQFAFPDLEQGAYTLIAMKSEEGIGTVTGIEVGTVDVLITLSAKGGVGGRVYDQSTGEGIEGIAVGATKVSQEEPGVVDTFLEQIQTRKTDASGNYELHLFAPASYTVSVRDPGPYIDPSPYPADIHLAKGEEIGGIDFALTTGAELSGKVLGPEEEAISGASVTLINLSHGGFDGVESGEDGKYEFTGLGLGGSYVLVVNDEKYGAHASGRFDIAPGQDIPSVDLRLGAGNTVYGQVIDTAGQPMVGVQVGLSINFQDLMGFGMSYGYPTTTNADGSFTISNVSPGTYSAIAEAPGYHHAFEMFTMPADSDYYDLVIVVRPEEEGSISGHLADQDGNPIQNATVFASNYGAQITAWSQTDGDGAFNIEGLGGAESYAIRISAEGFVDQNHVGEYPVNSTDVEITLYRLGQIRGKVVDAATGIPIDRFEVRVARRYDPQQGEASYRRGIWEEFTSPTGEFLLTEVPSPAALLAARAAGFATATTDDYVEVPPGGTAEGVVIRLARGAAITGTVVDIAGAPIPGARVAPFEGRLYPQLLDQSGAGSYAMTDAEGRFRLEGLTPDSVINLAAWRNGYAPDAIMDMRVRAGEPTEVSLTLTQGGRLVGVVYKNSQPIPKLPAIAIRQDGPFPYQAVQLTDEKGQFTLSGTPEGRYSIEILQLSSNEALWTGSADVAEGETTELEIEIDENAVAAEKNI